MLKKIYRVLRTTIKGFTQKNNIDISFKTDFDHFNSIDNQKKLSCNWEDIYPCLSDNTKTTNFDAHYIYHPAWAARIVKQINPEKHIDISSTLHFCSILSAFVPVEFYDFRPAHLNLSELTSGQADLTKLPFETNSIESISCMHTVEHIGLGRYGDPIDPDGDVKAINELKRVVKPTGNLLFVVPVGRPRIAFNAHRIYAPNMIIDLFEGFKLENFSLVTDSNDFIDNATLEEGEKQNYGCGCFWFIKI
ncbi:ubiquinone/menaquinone biosynthesis C-methylase UbiE [Pedobacter sp. UYP30]|uniref:DUF268 domain-containing protein n=1 Tax=Pedobacter sp. UYP30 TaxID=1756400 RepID=UPI0033964221